MSKKKYSRTTIKIIAVIFAVIMWTYVMSEMNPSTDKEFKNVKVELLNVETLEESGVVLMEPKEATIYVKIAGRRNDLFNITSDDIVAQVDLMGYSEGINKIPVEVLSPYKTEIVEFEPKQLLFKFDAITQKQLPVSIRTVGKTADGYSVGEGLSSPSAVFVRGPSSWVNSVAKVVASVEVENLADNINVSVPVKAVDSKGKEVNNVELSPKVVDVSVPIFHEKIVTIEPQITGNPLKGFLVTNVIASPRTVKIRGYDEVLNGITSLKTETLDVSYTIDDIKRDVPLIVPDGIEVIEYSEGVTVRIRIEEIIQKTFEYDFEDISLIKTDSDIVLDKNSIPEKISITVEGIESLINQLSPNEVSPYINLENLSEGKHFVEINIESPQGIELVNIEPENIEISLEKITNDDSNNEDEQEIQQP